MAATDITIPYPALLLGETFNVTIKDSSGATVFTGVETNAAFTVSLPTDDYQMFVDYDGAINTWCFRIVDCDCPPAPTMVVTVDLSGPTPLYYAEISFDYSGVSPFAFGCPFTIKVEDITTARIATINSFSDFTSHVGAVYTKKILMIRDHARVQIFKSFAETLCYDQLISYGCTPPAGLFFPASNAISLISGTWYINFAATALGTTCQTIDINYTRIVPPGFPGDSGTFTIDVSTLGPLPTTFNMPIHPVGSLVPKTYAISYTDCCGNTTTAPYYATSY